MLSSLRLASAFAAAVLFASQATATVCNGPDLSNIAVLADGVLEVHGAEHVARSRDGGRTWEDVAGAKALDTPFWKRSFHGADGVLYQNLIVAAETLFPVVIASRDGGRTWKQERFGSGGMHSLVVWSDEHGIFRVYANDVYARDDDTVMARGWFEGLPPEPGGPADRQPFVTFQFHEAITGFSIGSDRALYMSTERRIVRSRDMGQSWQDLNTPQGWMKCNGDPPRPAAGLPAQ